MANRAFRARWSSSFDAVLYLVPATDITMSKLPKALCADPGYMKMRRERIALAGMKRDLDRLNEQCVGNGENGRNGETDFNSKKRRNGEDH